VKGVLICNPWERNLGKLRVPKVFVDLDLVKELIKCYSHVTKSFHRKDKSVFLALDKDTFIEAFDLGEPMPFPIDIQELNGRGSYDPILLQDWIHNNKHTKNKIICTKN